MTSSTTVRELFHARTRPAVARHQPGSAAGDRPARRVGPRLGQPAIMLSVGNDLGGALLLAFTRARGGIAFWRSRAPDRSGLERAGTFPGPFTPRIIGRLLASGAAGPAIDADLAGSAWVDGVDGPDADLIRLAWCRHQGRVDPRVAAVLALPGRAVAEACERTGEDGVDALLELGGAVIEADREWLARHRASVDAEVDRRASQESAGETRRRELRAFVERCLLALGRLPRADETAERWDGSGLAGRDLGVRERRRLGLLRTRRVGRFQVRLRYLHAVETTGWDDVAGGPGWFWDVTNPDPGWVMNCMNGPYETPGDASSDASQLRNEG